MGAVLVNTNRQPSGSAALVTDLIQTGSKCVQLDTAQLPDSSPSFLVRLSIWEVPRDVAIEDKEELIYSDTIEGPWKKVQAKLTAGLQRVVIQVTRPEDGISGVIIDNIKIVKCSNNGGYNETMLSRFLEKKFL